jgi:hypothetical protein
MNVAYKHLDTRLRIADLTIGQWLGVVGGAVLALVWGLFLSPFGMYPTLVSAIYVGAVPAGATFLASVTEFDLWLLIRSAIRWRRREGRFLPGPGRGARGYALRADSLEDGMRAARHSAADLDLASLWEDS